MRRTMKYVWTGLLVLLLSGQWISAPVNAAAAVNPAAPTPEALATPVAVAMKPDVATNALANAGNQVLTYQEPSGLYSVPVPPKWTAQPTNDYVLLSSPQEQIKIYILTMAESNVQAAVDQAWAKIEPNFSLKPQQVTEIPSLHGLEKIEAYTYDIGTDSGKVVLALGQVYKGIVYVALMRSDLIALQERAAQVNLIQSGFTIFALRETTLIGAEPQRVDQTITTQLEAYINEAMVRFHIPGAAVAIVQGGQTVYSKGFGVRKLGSSDPVTPNTLMLIGSTTKTMTTMMMATMVDDHLMDWDTPVVKELPSFKMADPTTTRQITMRNLVCACTGVPRRDFELFFNSNELTAEGIVESLKDYKLFTGFGEAFQYSNQMVAVGGYAAAAAAGGQYGHLYDQYVAEMQKRIFNPIGMDHTTFSFAQAEASGNYAQPHSVNLDLEYNPLPLSIEHVVTPVAPAGGAWSNVQDLSRYLITLLNTGKSPDDKRVVSVYNLATTWKPQVAVAGRSSYGLGWFVEQYKGLRLLDHEGNTAGFTADLAFLPQADLGITVLTNVQGANFFTEAVRYRLFELVFGQPEEYDAQANYSYQTLRQGLLPPGFTLGKVDPRQVQNDLGFYHNAALGDINIELVGNRLLMDVGEAVLQLRPRLNQKGQLDKYVIYDPPMLGIPVEFKRDAQGNLTVVLGDGVTEYVFTPED